MTCEMLLVNLGACREAVLRYWSMSLHEAWSQCDRGDWMLWLSARMAGVPGWPTRAQVALAACACAELALPIFEEHQPGDTRPREAIETARAWARGQASVEQVATASSAALAARDGTPHDAAAYAANAAAHAAATVHVNVNAYAAAGSAPNAYAAAGSAASAYAEDACDSPYAAAYGAARRNVLARCADVCRSMLFVLSAS